MIKRRTKPRRGPTRDKAYLDFVRSFPCVICWGFPGVYQPAGTCKIYWDYEKANGCPSQGSKTESAHSGPHGLSQKAGDDTALPLCGIEHHREGPNSYHKMGRKFFEFHGLDREALIGKLRAMYERTKPE